MPSHGENLWNIFEKLHIIVAKIGINVIDGWFDTNSKELLTFLTFFINYISEENTLPPVDMDEWKELGTIPFGESQSALLGDEAVLDFKENSCKVGMLKNQKDSFSEYISYLEDLINEKKAEIEKTKKLLSAAEMEKLISKVDLEKAGEVCLCSSEVLDDVNAKLFQTYNSSNFVTSFRLLPKYDFNENTNMLHLVLMEKVVDSSNAQSLIETCKKVKYNKQYELGNIDEIKNRIFKSTEIRKTTEIVLAQLREKKEFLRETHVMSLVSLSRDILSIEISLNDNLQSKENMYGIWMTEFNNKLCKILEGYVDKNTLLIQLENLNCIDDRLNHYRNLKDIIVCTFSYCFFLHSMFTTKELHVKRCYDKFKTYHKHVVEDSRRCNSRINSMLSIIRECEQYEMVPAEQKSVTLNALIRFLLPGCSSDDSFKSVCNRMSQLKKECYDLEKKFFFEEPEVLGQWLKDLNANTKILKKFIVNGPTLEFISLHYNLRTTFAEVNRVFALRNNTVREGVNILNKTIERVNKDKWLKNKRLLWMYFLLDPKKMLRLIEQIEQEVLTRWKENVT